MNTWNSALFFLRGSMLPRIRKGVLTVCALSCLMTAGSVVLFLKDIIAAERLPETQISSITAESAENEMIMHLEALAKADQENQSIHAALYRWQVIAELRPEHSEANGRILVLQKLMREMAAKYKQTADQHLAKNNLGGAYKNYLRALSYDPYNQEVFNKVKNELNAKSVIEYTAEKEVSLKEIAQEEYEDEKLAFVIAYYNNIDIAQKIAEKETVLLPVMVGVVPKKRRISSSPLPKDDDVGEQNVKNLLAQGNDFLTVGNYVQAAEIADAVLEKEPANQEAGAFKNRAYYALGQFYEQQKSFRAAISIYQQIKTYQDAKDKLEGIQLKVNQEAEKLYSQGVQYYVKDDLENAISAFTEALKWNPNHAQAKKSLEEAQALLEKLKKLQ